MAFARERLGNYFICWGTTASANGDAITALATVFIVVLTYQLAMIGARQAGISSQQARLADTSADAYRRSERAYVKMSHQTPGEGSALTLSAAGVPSVRMEAKNWGRTPARVTALVLQVDVRGKGQKLPPYHEFKFDQPFPMEHFLVPGTAFYFPGGFSQVENVEGIKSEEFVLRLVGYVEYVDRFGHRHRSGYARQYEPGGGLNNLSFANDVGYNDDVPISS